MGTVACKGFEDATEMEGADETVMSDLLQRNIIRKMLHHIFLRSFYGDEVIALQPGMYLCVRLIIRNILQYFRHHVQHQLIDLQPAAIAGSHQLQDVKMQELRFRVRADERGMQVVAGEELRFTILHPHLLQHLVRKFKDGAFIRHFMRMRYRALVLRFGDEDAAGEGIQRMPENIKNKIALPYKADAECFIVFGL